VTTLIAIFVLTAGLATIALLELRRVVHAWRPATYRVVYE
jgi:hypothetical protein